jgi:hypothetical protein
MPIRTRSPFGSAWRMSAIDFDMTIERDAVPELLLDQRARPGCDGAPVAPHIDARSRERAVALFRRSDSVERCLMDAP